MNYHLEMTIENILCLSLSYNCIVSLKVIFQVRMRHMLSFSLVVAMVTVNTMATDFRVASAPQRNGDSDYYNVTLMRC